MGLTNEKKTRTAPDTPSGASGALRKWASLFLGFFLVWIFIFVMAPWLQTSQYVEPLAVYIEENNIDASALYYTEVEEASIAELNMRSTMEYRPKGP